MSTRDDEPQPMTGEILSPGEPGPVDHLGRPIVISIIERARNRVLTKELQSHTAKVHAWNGLVAALRDSKRLEMEYQAELVRASQLPLLRTAEELKIFAWVQQIIDDEANRRKHVELEDVRMDAELIKAKRELERLKRQPEPQQDVSRGQRKIQAVKRTRDERDEMISLVANARSDADLTDEDRRLISDIRLAAEDEIKRILEEGAG